MKRICKTLGCVWVIILALSVSAAAKQRDGTLSGVILDPSGLPQMGATVRLISEDGGGRIVSQLLSNQHGAFYTNHLKPGKYSVRVSLTGFLPALERHVAVMADLTTVLRVQMDSIFASLDSLRRKPVAPIEPDDWKWVLRSSTATRAILQWRDSDSTLTASAMGSEMPRTRIPHGMVQITNGSVRPGFSSQLPDSPATALSYDQQLGRLGRILLAGQMNYARGTSGTFASVWLPSGTAENGPQTVFVMQQSKVGVDGLAFQELRLDHTEQLSLSDRLSLLAGAEYLRAGIVTSVSTVRPHAQLDAKLHPGWAASFIVAGNPPSAQWGQTGPLQSALAELNSLPPVLFHDGAPVLEGGWHEELSLKHKLTSGAKLEIAAFHDSVRHQAILGSGPAASPEFLQDAFSSAFLYDGGKTSSWGTRLAFQKKLSDNLEFTALYSWAGALSPTGALNAASPDLRDNIATQSHHSVAARISGKLPRTNTQFTASYKWVSGTTLSRMDAFGEAMYQIDPNLRLSIRQPLPWMNGRWEALADFSNLLAQGYVTTTGQDSQVVFVPVLRSFRGGVSFLF
ncbi:MAG TPA: carboxypeptidase-like regulatory domain-containing protein [Candidatus Dormibacteraeota bacterium]|nr:carboxypeptidase-like regulatory domain-containing protein [Candidatus Dormibacteraeota bacterium]